MILNKKTEIEWTPYLASAYAEGFCEGEDASEIEKVEAWAYIYDNNLHYSLQGFYGRTIDRLVEANIFDKTTEGTTINWEELNIE